VHGRHAAWVLNLEANPTVRLRHLGKWRTGTATIESVDDDKVKMFNPYVRSAMRIAIDPVIVRITYS